LRNTDRNQVAETLTTDANGVYSVPLLILGTYSIRVERLGFKTNTRSGIVLNAKDILRINMKMEVGAVTETIEVKENPVAIELGTLESSSTIEGEQIRELALGTRNFAQLVSLMPGVVDTWASTSCSPGPPAQTGRPPSYRTPSTECATRTTTGRWMAAITWIAAAT
jgi:hypothetical protein